MKNNILIGLFASLITFPAAICCKSAENLPSPAGCLKGKLEIAGICRNYTISVTGGNIDSSRVEKTWTDPNTNKTYQNVFRLGSSCSFPNDIKEGDEFYFTITDKEDKDCATCLAYYPTPQKKLFISVQNSGCDTQ